MEPEAAESGWLENIVIQDNVFEDVGYFIDVRNPPQPSFFVSLSWVFPTSGDVVWLLARLLGTLPGC
jgi:hypothetical protein